MKGYYAFMDGELRATDSQDAPVRLYAAPNSAERDELMLFLGLDAYDLNATLDPDEIPRLEQGVDTCTLIWKHPCNVSVAEQLRFEVESVAIFLHDNTLIMITSDPHLHFKDREFRGMADIHDLLLRLQLQTVHHYLGHLKAIKQLSAELGSKLSGAMENRYYLQMLALSESLIYYVDGIEANLAVLGKLRSAGPRLGLSNEQMESLHNILLDTQQCARQANIYSSVLSGLMDARGTIINNNVNTLLRKLTLISVIFLPLNLLAGIGGMSEFSIWTQKVDWRIAYGGVLLGMGCLGWLMWIVVQRLVEQRGSPHSPPSWLSVVQRRWRAFRCRFSRLK